MSRLEVKDTLEVLWDEDVHPRSQLKVTFLAKVDNQVKVEHVPY